MDFPAFLRATLPPLGLAWRRHHRRSVRRRIVQRMDALRLRSFEAYREHLLADPDERAAFPRLLGVTITRLFRDRPLLERSLARVLSAWNARAPVPRSRLVWSAGCAGGEEPYSVAMMIASRREAAGPRGVPDVRIVASDVDERCLARAERGVYAGTSLREVPAAALRRFFEPRPEGHRVRDEIRALVRFERRDVRLDPPPPGPVDLLLSRNLAFTYFSDEERVAFAERAATIVRGGFLIIGSSESMPARAGRWFRRDEETPILHHERSTRPDADARHG